MKGKIAPTVAALLVTLSSVAVAGTADVPHRMSAAQVQQGWAAPAAEDMPNAHHYHGGPKAND